jgi:hypothetical protein
MSNVASDTKRAYSAINNINSFLTSIKQPPQAPSPSQPPSAEIANSEDACENICRCLLHFALRGGLPNLFAFIQSQALARRGLQEALGNIRW